MTKLEHALELVFDIRDCSKRSRDLGFADRAEYLGRIADDIEHWSKREWDSLQGRTHRNGQNVSIDDRDIDAVAMTNTHATTQRTKNQEARATASKHFQEARRLLKGIK